MLEVVEDGYGLLPGFPGLPEITGSKVGVAEVGEAERFLEPVAQIALSVLRILLRQRARRGSNRAEAVTPATVAATRTMASRPRWAWVPMSRPRKASTS
jgi:hypothetical protein